MKYHVEVEYFSKQGLVQDHVGFTFDLGYELASLLVTAEAQILGKGYQLVQFHVSPHEVEEA